MLAMGVAEEGDVNGVELGFYVGELWVSMDVSVVHVRPPFQTIAAIDARGSLPHIFHILDKFMLRYPSSSSFTLAYYARVNVLGKISNAVSRRVERTIVRRK